MSLLFHRPNRLFYACLWSLCCLCLLLTTHTAAAETPDKLNIFVSVLPQKYIVEKIAGDTAQVNTMVQPGDSPATYEPNPRQISKLSKADLYIRVGVAFENAWMDRIRAVNPAMPVLDARAGLKLLTLADHDHSHEHEHDLIPATKSNQDPHIWTSPRIAARMAAQVAAELSEMRPAQQTLFASNLADFTAELEQLDKELTKLFANTKQRKFMVFHPSWGYFADAYGLTQLPIEADGKEPGAKALFELIRQAREEGVKTIFVQPQFDKRIAAQVAKAIDGNVVSVDPLAEDYVDNLRQAARLIAGIKGEQ